jgi:hypothetical protein
MPRKRSKIVAEDRGSSDIIEHVHCGCVSQLEDDVRDLKRRLAALHALDPLSVADLPVKRTGLDGYLASLHPQDREFMAKRLGRAKR